MSTTSIVLGVLSVLCIGLGVLFTPVPVLGTLLSFAAPALALASVITGGVAMSRARREGKGTEAATAGVLIGGLAFVPALMVALTCGVCNALCSASTLQGGPVKFHVGPGMGPDGGMPFGPRPGLRRSPNTPPSAPPTAPTTRPVPADPAAPPPAFPPPPMDP